MTILSPRKVRGCTLPESDTKEAAAVHPYDRLLAYWGCLPAPWLLADDKPIKHKAINAGSEEYPHRIARAARPTQRLIDCVTLKDGAGERADYCLCISSQGARIGRSARRVTLGSRRLLSSALTDLSRVRCTPQFPWRPVCTTCPETVRSKGGSPRRRRRQSCPFPNRNLSSRSRRLALTNLE